MKTHTMAVRSVLASVMLVSMGLGVDAAQANSRRDQDLINWGRRQGYECQRQRDGVFCRPYDKTQDDDRFESDRTWRSNRIRRGRVEEGTLIQTKSNRRGRIVLERNETLPLTLYVDRDIRDRNNRYVIIPRDSQIEGWLRPKNGGVRFEADDIILRNGRRYNIRAESDIIYPDRRADRSTSGNSRISDAARVILGSVLGRSNGRIGDVFGRSESDVFGSSRTRARRNVVVVDPERDLDLQLTSDLRIR